MNDNILYLKLVNGDNIISYVENNMESLILSDPMQIFVYNTYKGASIKLAKWIPYTEKEDFIIDISTVLLSCEVEQDVIDYYIEAKKSLKYYHHDNEENHKVIDAMYEKYANNSIKVH